MGVQIMSSQPPVHSIRPIRKMSGLLGFLLKFEVDAAFKQQPFEPLSDGDDPIALWRRSFEGTRSLQPVPQARIEPLDESLRDAETEIRSRRTYRESYEAVADYSFGMAPIDALLSPQWFADLNYIDELSEGILEGAALDAQLRFAMSEGTITEPIIVGNQVVFTSPRRDLHADQIPTVREIGAGEFEIVVRAVSRPNYIQVNVLGERLLLTNGVHKVCAFYKRGFRQVPCVWRSISRIEESGLNLQGTTLFRPELFNSARPAQVVDFLNERVAVPLKMRSMYQVMRIALMLDVGNIPSVLSS